MKFVLALICLISVVMAADENTHVLTLDSTNFQDALKNNPMIMVEFYAPWCGHCKRLAPEYEKAAEELKGSGLILAAINADDEPNRPITQQFGIQGFPTLKFFRNGQPKDYEGDRTSAAIVAFMRKQNRPAISSISATNEEVLKFGDSDRVVILGTFDKAEGPEYEIFKTTAEANRDKFTFGQVVGDAEFAKSLGAPVPNVLLFKKFDEGKNILGNDFTGLVQFINTNSVPVIDEIGGHNYKFYAESGLPLGYVFVKPEENKLVTELHDMAKNTKGKVNWVWIDFNKYARHGERLGLSGKVAPAVAIEHNGKHWAFDEKAEVTAAAVVSWVDQYVAGTLQETVRSEEVPATQTEPVIKVVAKSWDAVVGDSNKDVFIMFYAPWCGHCKALHPTFEQLATKLKGVNSVSIAQIDATANDVDPKLGIRGFPTLKLFPANDKANVIDYEGDRSLDDMLRFIQNGASIDFKIPAAKEEASRDEL